MVPAGIGLGTSDLGHFRTARLMTHRAYICKAELLHISSAHRVTRHQDLTRSLMLIRNRSAKTRELERLNIIALVLNQQKLCACITVEVGRRANQSHAVSLLGNVTPFLVTWIQSSCQMHYLRLNWRTYLQGRSMQCPTNLCTLTMISLLGHKLTRLYKQRTRHSFRIRSPQPRFNFISSTSYRRFFLPITK